MTGRAQMREIVAVTFTEKAAGELKLRLREALELQRREAADRDVVDRLEQAIATLEEAHVSTIHGFCAELLRERPVEARVDPHFEVLTEAQAERLYRQAFDLWLEEALHTPPEGLRRSLRRASRPSFVDGDDGPIERLRGAGWRLVEWRDFTEPWQRDGFDREEAIADVAARLHAFVDLTASPAVRNDPFYVETVAARHVSEALRHAETPDYDGWEGALVELSRNTWFRRARRGAGKMYGADVTRAAAVEAHAALIAALDQFRVQADADLAALLQQELQGSIKAYETLKSRQGTLDFLDLLVRARNLVRDCEPVRRTFQQRFTRIFVDEFQDTDPLQAEILLLLAADDPSVADSRRVVTVPGKLFIVGDPKQSIYRFRRADVGVYQSVCRQLRAHGALPVLLHTSFRAVPSIQSAVNAAFAPVMDGDEGPLQAAYVPLSPFRQDPQRQPAIVALPVPKPYKTKKVAMTAIEKSLPDAAGAFIDWLLRESGWTVTERTAAAGGERRVPLKARHICILFRRFISWDEDVTRPYVDALEARGVPHLLVGGRSFHEREEVESLRAALAAIEWPDDELSVFATLHGPFFAIGDEELLAYSDFVRRKTSHARSKSIFHPFRVPTDLPEELKPIADALGLLRSLHRSRNYRPVAETISRLLEATRAHVAFVLRQAGEQALANVLHVAELARQYEIEGGISFRGFVEELREAAARARAAEAPILEEGSDGVRLMTVHKAKGLEFPVVVLADITAKLRPHEAGRYVDPVRGLCALKIGGWAPGDLLHHEAEELAREEAEGERLAYVAATRARDLLVVPAVGDGPWEEGWIAPLNGAIYPGFDTRRTQISGPGCPVFTSKDSVLSRPNDEPADERTVCPGLHVFRASGDYGVVWWDPKALSLDIEQTFTLRREDLIVKDVSSDVVDEGLATYESWRTRRAQAVAAASRATLSVLTATEWAKSEDRLTATAPEVVVLNVGGSAPSTLLSLAERPGGARYGTLVHAVLATVPLDADETVVHDVAAVQGRIIGARDDEIASASAAVVRVLSHPMLVRARAAASAGRAYRETPIALVVGDTLIEGVVDLAFEDAEGLTVLDFKTDRELEDGIDRYRRQLQLYAAALGRTRDCAVSATLLKV
jgi:ATP-dependent helicase/nuclease subunit A